MSKESVLRDGRPGWYRVYNDVLDQYGKVMGAYGIAVYNALCRFASMEGSSFPSHETIGELTGMSKRQVAREIDKLVELGLISKEPRAVSGMKQSNVYTILSIHRSATQSSPDLPHSHHGYDCVADKQDPIEQDLVEEEKPPLPPASSLESDKSKQYAEIVRHYHADIGVITETVGKAIQHAQDDFPAEWIIEAIQEAARYNKRSWVYAEKILNRWEREGRGPRASPNGAGEPVTITRVEGDAYV